MTRVPRQLTLFAGQFDAIPYMGVLFLLLMFLLLAGLVYTPGVLIQLPQAEGLPGVSDPVVAVAIDHTGKLFYENQIVSPSALKSELHQQVLRHQGKLVLVIRADKDVPYEKLVSLALLARETGIKEVLLATIPVAVRVREK